MAEPMLPFSVLVNACRVYASTAAEKVPPAQVSFIGDLRDIFEGLALQTVMASSDVLVMLTHQEVDPQLHPLSTLCSMEGTPCFPPEYETHSWRADDTQEESQLPDLETVKIEDWETAVAVFKIAHNTWRETTGIDLSSGSVNEKFEMPLCEFEGGVASFR